MLLLVSFAALKINILMFTLMLLANHLSLLVEPVVLPEDLSHLNIDKPGGSKLESDKCFFYPNGKKNENFRQVVANATSEGIARMDKKSKPKKPPIKPSHSSTKLTLNNSSTLESLRPKERLYYGRKADLKTENLLNTLRFNEAKILSILSPKT